jgi:DNA-binding HxlR family transcriptional regulator
MALLDLLGRRWCLRILWELHQNGPSSFRVLQRLCGDISPTILNTRLTELRESGIIELRPGDGYIITDQGISLGRIINQLNAWSKSWAEYMASNKIPLQDTISISSKGKNKKT